VPKALQQLVGLAAVVNMAVGWVLALHMVVGLEQKAEAVSVPGNYPAYSHQRLPLLAACEVKTV
jgi:hypothetical protein